MSTPIRPSGGDGDPGPSDRNRIKVDMVTIEELADMLENGTLLDHPEGFKVDQPTTLIKAFLLKNEPEFRRLMAFRVRGWVDNKALGDTFFKLQREKADNPDDEGEVKFYTMMIQIAQEMHDITGVFDLIAHHDDGLKVLDICMAPGGYTCALLKKHKDAKCYAITLSPRDGGHGIKMPTGRLAGLRYSDVTLLKTEFWGDRSIPSTHPSPNSFSALRPFKFDEFDLIFCDGMVLRTHQRPSWREENEITRLSCSQLLLAMNRVVTGGTIVLLLHKIDSWHSVSILYTFDKFSKVEVFKPAKKHAPRSSFYMIAKDVQPESEAARLAIEDWREAWWKATFEGPNGTGEASEDPPESAVWRVLEEFGPRLIEMGQRLWQIQADALSMTDYAGDASIHGEPGPSTPQRASDTKDRKENIHPKDRSPNVKDPKDLSPDMKDPK